jgi:hypothetical protein
VTNHSGIVLEIKGLKDWDYRVAVIYTLTISVCWQGISAMFSSNTIIGECLRIIALHIFGWSSNGPLHSHVPFFFAVK